jgi:hypothetical protein
VVLFICLVCVGSRDFFCYADQKNAVWFFEVFDVIGSVSSLIIDNERVCGVGLWKRRWILLEINKELCIQH